LNVTSQSDLADFTFSRVASRILFNNVSHTGHLRLVREQISYD
jgi:hypothetical protein